jgi:hypothetical protein
MPDDEALRRREVDLKAEELAFKKSQDERDFSFKKDQSDRELKLKEDQFEYDKTRSPFANIAVIVTIIIGLSGVGFQGLSAWSAHSAAVQAQADKDTAKINADAASKKADAQALLDHNENGLNLFFAASEKLLTCDDKMTEAQVGMFEAIYPDLTKEIGAAVDARRSGCAAAAANAAAQQAQQAKVPQAEVLAAALAARYNTLQQLATNAPAAATSALPTVYIQFESEDDRPAAIALQAALLRKGYGAPGIQKVSVAPNNSQVRYYHQDQKGMAQTAAIFIGAQLHMANPPATAPVGGQRDLPSGVIEFWFPHHGG